MAKQNGPRPLAGFRVVEFAHNVAGPLAGQVLADLGAEVIKVEAPEGDAARRIVSLLPGRRPLATYFLPNNRGKKSVALDLRVPENRQQVLRIIDEADVLLEAYRPQVMEQLGLGPEVLQARNPKLVYARLCAYARSGSGAGRPGIDMMVQTEAGMTSGLRNEDGSPQLIPFQLVDNACGHVLAQAVLAALLNRERHGVTDIVEVSMYDVAISLQANQLALHMNRAKLPSAGECAPAKPRARRPFVFATQPSAPFKAADGYLVLAAYVPKHWRRLTEVLERADLLEDPRFVDQTRRTMNFDALKAELEKTFASRTAQEWVARLQEAGLMASLPLRWKDVVRSQVFADNALAVSVLDGEQKVEVVRTPARYHTFEAVAKGRVPQLGSHNQELLERE